MSQQGGKQKYLRRENTPATEPLTANVQKLTPTRLGKGLSDFRLWYDDDPAVAAYAGALECQNIYDFCCH
ncbi:hypothetical protein KSB_93970 [Ktedonobacter robiniae]|uniref:Uncharacterized protein n=1 Tax=Ktedonobacter robiniae TaxID=2778365 RepID=A0ABQ3V7K6_9CHLR|nr:hypothetical protein KSB_93970 [Ktedonobacter robiniae]